MLGNQRGFTLLEVMVALGVLAVGLLGMFEMANITIEGNSASKMRMTGVMLCQDKIEALRQAGYNPTLVSTTTTTEAAIPGFPSYQRVTVMQVNTPGMGLQAVTSTVSWNTKLGSGFGLSSVTLQTLLAP